MERLTELHFKKTDGFYMKCSEHCCKEDFSCEDCKKFEKLVDRLGTIENILGDEYDLDHLRELVQADREGRCVVLPCREGDTVYRIVEDQFECNAEDAADPFMPTAEIVEEPFHISNFYDFGLFLFLNRAEAEDALRRAQKCER